MNYHDKDIFIEDVKDRIYRGQINVHPEEFVEAMDEIKVFAEQRKKIQQVTNDRFGIPDRPRVFTNNDREDDGN